MAQYGVTVCNGRNEHDYQEKLKRLIDYVKTQKTLNTLNVTSSFKKNGVCTLVNGADTNNNICEHVATQQPLTQIEIPGPVAAPVINFETFEQKMQTPPPVFFPSPPFYHIAAMDSEKFVQLDRFHVNLSNGKTKSQMNVGIDVPNGKTENTAKNQVNVGIDIPNGKTEKTAKYQMNGFKVNSVSSSSTGSDTKSQRNDSNLMLKNRTRPQSAKVEEKVVHKETDPLVVFKRYGYEKPLLFECFAFPPCIEGEDSLLVSGVGNSGKTTTAIVVALEHVRTSEPRECQVIILSLTRDISLRTRSIMDKLGQRIPNFKSCLCTADVKIADNIRDIRSSRVLVGTTGRIHTLIKDGITRMDSLKIMIFDDADDMLNLNLEKDICCILELTPKHVQVIFLATSMRNDLGSIANHFLREPIPLLMDNRDLNDMVKQYYTEVQGEHLKISKLIDLYNLIGNSHIASLIFAKSSKIEFIKRQLTHNGFNADALAFRMDPMTREIKLATFSSGRVQILITNDVFTRLIDNNCVSLVVNFDIPTKEYYAKRLERIKGTDPRRSVINIVSTNERERLLEIGRHFNTEINLLK